MNSPLQLRYDTADSRTATHFVLSADDDRVVIDCSAGVAGDARATKCAQLPIHTRLNVPRQAASELQGLLGRALGRPSTDIAEDDTRWKRAAESSAAAIELLARVGACDSLENACDIAANLVREHTDASTVAICLSRRGTKHRTRVAAISGHSLNRPQARRSTPATEAYEQAASECLVAGDSLDSAKNPEAKLVIQLAKQLSMSRIAAHPLLTEADQAVGVLLIAVSPKGGANSEDFVEAIGPAFAGVLQARQSVAESRLVQLEKTASNAYRGKRKWWLGGLLAMMTLVLCLPTPHRLAARCVVEPAERRYVTAAFDGLLRSSAVKAGDAVTSGQLLASMEDEKLRLEVAGLEAEASKAEKQRATARAAGQIAKSQMAALEVRRVRSRVRLLEDRLSRLAIKSPTDGIVLEGDLHDAQGAPVQAGQVLFAVAPLSELRIEVFVPQHQWRFLEVGMPIELSIEGDPDPAREAKVASIRPRAEVRHYENGFVAELTIDNADGKLRPGMTGQATLVAEAKPLGWQWFHRVWDRLTWLGV